MASPRFTSLFQARFQLNHVVVGVAETLRFTQAYAVDDRGVVQGVGDNRIFCAEQGLKQTAVSVEAGGVQNRVFHSEEARQLLLKLLMAVLRTADKAYGGHAETVGVHTVFCSGNQLRVIRKTQVVVRTKVDHMAAVGNGDVRLLSRRDNTLFLEQPFRTCGVEVAV